MPILIPLISRVVVWTGASYVATKVAGAIETTDKDIELEQLASKNNGSVGFGDILLVAGTIAGTVYVYNKFKKG